MHRPIVIWPLLGLVLILLATGCGASSVASAPNRTRSVPRIRWPQVYRVPSGSMEPTLPIGTRVNVKEGPLTVGAIVVFYPPESSGQKECGPKPHIVRFGGAACATPITEKSRIKLIKRIVAGPGDEIYVREGHVYRKANGSGKFARERDTYIRACGASQECNFPDPIKIPAEHWFLMGDNRGESDDSRFWGPVPTAWIVGTAANYALR